MTALLVLLSVTGLVGAVVGIAWRLRPVDQPTPTPPSPGSVFRARRYAEHLRHQVARATTAERLLNLSVQHQRSSLEANHPQDDEEGRP